MHFNTIDKHRANITTIAPMAAVFDRSCRTLLSGSCQRGSVTAAQCTTITLDDFYVRFIRAFGDPPSFDIVPLW